MKNIVIIDEAHRLPKSKAIVFGDARWARLLIQCRFDPHKTAAKGFLNCQVASLKLVGASGSHLVNLCKQVMEIGDPKDGTNFINYIRLEIIGISV